jgi:hypothetical protein
VQHGAAEDLHVEMPHVFVSAAGLPDGGKDFGQQVVQRFARSEPLAIGGGQGLEVLVRERLHVLFERIDPFENRAGNDRVPFAAARPNVAQAANDTLVAGAEHAAQEIDHPFAHGAKFVRKFFPGIDFQFRFGAHNPRPNAGDRGQEPGQRSEIRGQESEFRPVRPLIPDL